MRELGVVVPFYNEERTAAPVVEELLEALEASGLDYAVALVADGSTDGTVDALAQATRAQPRVRLAADPKADGYGAALLHGFQLLDATVVGWIDGDGQVPPEAVVDIYHAMRKGGALLGMGLRRDRQDGLLRAAASRGYNLLMNATLGLRLVDVNAKPKLLHRDLLHGIAPTSRDWFIDTEIVAGAVARGAPPVRVPVPFRSRTHGDSKVNATILAEYFRNLRRFGRNLRRHPPQPLEFPHGWANGSTTRAKTDPVPPTQASARSPSAGK